MDKINFALESFKNIQDLIKFVDQKSSAVLVITGLIFTGYIQYLQGLVFSVTEGLTFYGVLTFLTSAISLFSILMVIQISIIKVLKPRSAKYYVKDEISLFYHEHLEKIGREGVLEAYKTLKSEVMLKNIIDQQHEVSRILMEKSTQLGRSFNWLFASIVFVMMFVIFSTQL